MESDQAQCPIDCHACCKLGITLDLTSVEALMVYLLNRDMVDLLEEYISLHVKSDYCPYMIKDKCIINNYKPTACQMFMPFVYKGKAMCFYLADKKTVLSEEESSEGLMNSSSYSIHGYMMMLQSKVGDYLPVSFFKNTIDGTLWWKEHYHSLPDNTQNCLESILTQGHIGKKLTSCFDYKVALQAGSETYSDLCEKHRDLNL